ncbi:MAG: hypothetical protein ACOX08_11350 [Methanobacterium sp.]|jgi:hypothetical protein
MFSEIITTLESNIGSIQLNLFDFGVENPKFEEILNARFQTPETPRNVNKNLKLLANNHLELSHPYVPIVILNM